MATPKNAPKGAPKDKPTKADKPAKSNGAASTAASAQPTAATPIELITGHATDTNVKLALVQMLMSSNIIHIGGKRVAEIQPELLDVAPEYQRPADIKRAIEIAKEWDDNRYNFPKVAYRDGKLWVLDGQHTTLAAILAGVKNLGIIIIEGITIYTEAELFDTQDKHKVKVSHINKYFSMLFRRHPVAVAIDRICKKYHLTVMNVNRGGRHAAHTTTETPMTAIALALKLVANPNLGEACLDWCFGVMDASKCWFVESRPAATHTHINMLATVYARGISDGRLDEYRDKLVTIMSHANPYQFDKIASAYARDPDARAATKILCRDIIDGKFNLQNPVVINDPAYNFQTPVETGEPAASDGTTDEDACA